MYTVYSLVDPRNNATRYVGISENIYSRFAQHIRCDSGNQAKDTWIQELKDASVMLIMTSLEHVEGIEEARTREQHWIKHFTRQGASLLNQQDLTIFTYDDFQSFFGKEEELKPKEKRGESVSLRQAKQDGKRGAYFISVRAASDLTGYTERHLWMMVRRGQIATNANKDKLKTSDVMKFSKARTSV